MENVDNIQTNQNKKGLDSLLKLFGIFHFIAFIAIFLDIITADRDGGAGLLTYVIFIIPLIFAINLVFLVFSFLRIKNTNKFDKISLAINFLFLIAEILVMFSTVGLIKINFFAFL